MGIPNLLRILKNITKKQSLSSYKGKKAGIDGYTWLHRSLYCIGEGILKNPIDITKCINYFTKKLQLLLRNEIIPIFIFDGDKLPMKINEEDKREIKRKEYEKEAENMLKMNNIYGAIYKKIEAFDVTPEFAYEFMKILKNYNIEYYVAPYEADAQLAYLSNINYIDFIITEDSDLLAYGCKCVLFKLGNLKNEPIDVGEEILWENIKNSKEIKFKNFSKDKFLSFCILCGCDYLKISGVGPKLSNEALNKFDDYNKFLGYVFNKNCIQGSIIETIKKYEKTFLTFRYQVVYCPNEKKMKYFNDINEHLYPFLDKYKNDLSFLGIVDFDNIDEYVHGEINPITKKEIDENNNSFYISTNIYDISYYKKNYNNQRTEEDELFVKDDQSEDSNSTCGNNNKYISQYNFCQKFGKYKGPKKQKKSEKPKNQIGIESFFLNNNNNKKDNKKIKKIKKTSKNKIKNNNNLLIKENNNDENNENNNQNNNEDDKSQSNDENNVNMSFLNDYTFNIDNISNITNINNKRNFNDLDLYKNNKQKNLSKNYQQKSGLHLSNSDLNACYNPLTQLKKETKKDNKNSSINSKQKKIYNKFSLKFKDEDEEEDKKPDLGFLDNYNFSETNFDKNYKNDLFIPFSSGDIDKKCKNDTNYFINKPGTYMESFIDDYSDKKIYERVEKIIRIEDEKQNKDDIKSENEKDEIKSEEKTDEGKKDEDKDEDEDEDENKKEVKDDSFNFDSYKNTFFSLDKF